MGEKGYSAEIISNLSSITEETRLPMCLKVYHQLQFLGFDSLYETGKGVEGNYNASRVEFKKKTFLHRLVFLIGNKKNK